MTETPLEVTVTATPTSEEIAWISGSLDDFNVRETGIEDRQSLAVLAKDPDSGEVVGGLTGRTSLGLLFVDLFYLPPSMRGEGLGSKMLQAAEDEARARGCLSGVVYTISFQAPGFYLKHGWRVFGEVPCEPAGTSRVFMSKVFA